MNAPVETSHPTHAPSDAGALIFSVRRRRKVKQLIDEEAMTH